MRRLWAALLVAGLAGCGRSEVCDNGSDDDGDGFVDCDDQDCFDACGEACDNAVDDDGDGLVDCLDDDCETTCEGRFGTEDCTNGKDDDGDFIVDCFDREDCQPICDNDGDGAFRTDLGGQDCDDDDSDVFPGATEVPYNDKDDDCDPQTSDTDVDGDGVDAVEVGGPDCNDANPDTFPGAPETCGDREVNDCDAPDRQVGREECYADRSARTADATLLGNSLDDWAGYAVAHAGDTNGDGYADIAIGAYGEDRQRGAVYLVHGPVEGRAALAVAAVKWVNATSEDWAGYAIAGGHDVTGDGRPDVIIGAQYDDDTDNTAGAVYVVDPDASGTVDLEDAYAKILGGAQFDQAGASVASPGDLTGDGKPDLLIGANLDGPPTEAGAAYIVPGPIARGTSHLAHVTSLIQGQGTQDRTGCSVSGAGDLDGDGVQDVVVGSCLRDAQTRMDRGAVHFFSSAGYTELPRTVEDADGNMLGERARDQLGFAVGSGGDLDDDGTDDFVAGAPYHDLEGEKGPLVDVGKAYVAFGPAGDFEITPDVHLYGLDPGDETGTSVTGIGDLNGDDVDDLAVGAPGRDVGGEVDAGAVFVLFGPLEAGHVELSDADFVIEGAAAFDFTGTDVGTAGDFDDDGNLDLLVGAPFHDGLAPSAGATYVFTFGY